MLYLHSSMRFIESVLSLVLRLDILFVVSHLEIHIHLFFCIDQKLTVLGVVTGLGMIWAVFLQKLCNFHFGLGFLTESIESYKAMLLG